jgi:threonine aldolase
VLPDLRPLALELGALESHSARWEADPPGALTPQLRIVDGAESALEPEKVRARIETFLAVAAEAWDPFATRGTP